MKSLIACLAAALALSGNVNAEPSAPPPVPAATAQPPAPTPAPAPAAQAPAPTARKEDEPASLTILQRVAAFASGRQRAAENTASLQAQIDGLTQSVATRDATIDQLQATVQEQTEMLQQIGSWLVENGHSDPSSVAANPAAAFGEAVGTGVAAAVRTIGIPSASVPTAPAPSACGTSITHAELEEQLAACKSIRERQDFLAKHKDLIFGKN
jgi:pyruvate/2-oxoglutarate dehydrogenase complex dihydrolipoamide acyltransferase (E2) component